MVAIFALIYAKRARLQAVFKLRQARTLLGGVFVWVADLMRIAHPAFLWLVWLIVLFLH